MKKILLIAILLGGISGGYLQAGNPLAPLLEIIEQNPSLTSEKGFDHWMAQRQRELNGSSSIAQTTAGPIEYRKGGAGPVVICLHGAFGGYDASYLLGENLISRGFTVIAVSRPGYLRTPLSVGASPVEQAEAMIALMDTLKIDKAAVLGFSAGTLPAFQMSLRHPDRIWACVLQGVGAIPADFEPGATYDQLRALVLDDDLVLPLDAASWFLYDFARSHIRPTADLVLPDDVLETMPADELAERILFVQGNAQQKNYLRRFVYSLTPYSLRRDGDYNDIKDDISIDPWQSWVDAGMLQDFTVPCQVIQGVWDSSGNYEEAQNLIAANIPNCQLVTVQGTGHFVWLGENFRDWDRQMVTFLQENRPRKARPR